MRIGKSRIFLISLLAFIGGIAIRSFFATPLSLLGVAILWITSLYVFRAVSPSWRFMLSTLMAVCMAAGVMRMALITATASIEPHRIGAVHGVVIQEPIRTDVSQRIILHIHTSDILEARTDIEVLTRRVPKYQVGDMLNVAGRFEPPEREEGRRPQNIVAFSSFPTVTLEGKDARSLAALLAVIKHAFEERIEFMLPEPHSALLKGLLLGNRESIPGDIKEDLRRSGTSHIVALSGYNITLVGRALMWLLLFLAIPFQAALWIAIAGIILFVLMTGASASVVRAGIMGILVLLAEREGRAYYITNALAAAGALMLLYDPYILRFDVGFGLSFLAAMGIVYVAPYFNEKARTFGYIAGEIKPWQKIFIETVAAQVAVLPLLVYVFGTVSLVSPLANLVILIAVPYAMLTGFIATLSVFLWQGFAVVGWVTWFFLEYIFVMAHLAALFPGASFATGPWALIPIIAAYAVFVWRAYKEYARKIHT